MRPTIFVAFALVAFAAAAPSVLVRRADAVVTAPATPPTAKHHRWDAFKTYIKEKLGRGKTATVGASAANDAAQAPATALVRRADAVVAAAPAAPVPAKHHHWTAFKDYIKGKLGKGKTTTASASAANDAAQAPATALVRRADAVVAAPAALAKHPRWNAFKGYIKGKFGKGKTTAADASTASDAAQAPATALVRRAGAVVVAPAAPAAPESHHPYLHGLKKYLTTKAEEYMAKHVKGKTTAAGAAAAAAPTAALVRRADAVVVAPAAPTAPESHHPHLDMIKGIVKEMGMKYFQGIFGATAPKTA